MTHTRYEISSIFVCVIEFDLLALDVFFYSVFLFSSAILHWGNLCWVCTLFFCSPANRYWWLVVMSVHCVLPFMLLHLTTNNLWVCVCVMLFQTFFSTILIHLQAFLLRFMRESTGRGFHCWNPRLMKLFFFFCIQTFNRTTAEQHFANDFKISHILLFTNYSAAHVSQDQR